MRDVVVVSMHYYGFCMDIVDYLDCAGHIILVVMFVVVAFCSLDD